MIPSLRLTNQQLVNPQFENPKDLVSWMGAIQAQDYQMVKWATGMRLKNGTLETVEKALIQGNLIRTHVMRPTWHLVPAEDLCWMLDLSARKNRQACNSFVRQLEISDLSRTRFNQTIEKILQGKHLTKQEIIEELNKKGLQLNPSQVNWLLTNAEIEKIICSGADKNKKATHALITERIPVRKDLQKEEALALLATRYFRSHSPATLEDFIWWSGLTTTEARLALSLIDKELIKDKWENNKFLIHENCKADNRCDNTLHFIPPYDEYLISYKDRTHVLSKEHYPKAFTNYGIFYPVIAYNGNIIGNWKKRNLKKEISLETSFFVKCNINQTDLNTQINHYRRFLGSCNQ